MYRVGKTTLAEMLLFAHLEQGYQPVVIQGNITEGKKFFKNGEKQIFYFDDFLGQTFLGDRKEYLGRNEDAAIVDFVDMIQRSEHGRFILTAREHILRSALQISERFAHSPLIQHRCVIELGDFSYAQKARILYNHIYFSDLPQSYRDAMLEDRFFLEVIKHKHFNPRLIEWLSTYTRLQDVPPENYREHIVGLLTAPEAIWSHAFENQISGAARHALLALYTIGEWVETVDLEPAFLALHRHCAAKYNERTVPGEFRKALQELDGAFLSYSRNHASFLNPSVREFVASLILNDSDTATDLLASAIRIWQVAALWELAQAHPGQALSSVLKADEDSLFDVLSRLLPGPSVRWERMQDGSQRGYFIDMNTEGRIAFIMEVASALQSTRFAELAIQAAKDLATSWSYDFPEFGAATRLLEKIGGNTWFLSHGGQEANRTLVDSMMNELNRATASDWLEIMELPNTTLDWSEADEEHLSHALTSYCDSGVHDEMFNCTTLDEKSELKGFLEELTEKYGLDFAYAITRLEEEIAEREQEELEDYDDERGFGAGGSMKHEEVMTDDDISQMFSTLRDSGGS